MELPQSRPFGTEGRKPTHDFLSLYSHATVQQDPRPPPQVPGGYLKTHDFLQPLDKVGKTGAAKEETPVEISSAVETPAPPAQPPPSSVEHILPGGIGTYSISHISYFNQKVPKPEGTIFSVAQTSSTERNDENSNCSSYTGSGFTLWEESAVKKGKTGKENTGERSSARESAAKARQWASVSSSNNNSNSHRNSISSRSSSQPGGTKSQSFMEMIKSAAKGSQDEELDDEDDFIMKKENSTTTTTTTTPSNHRGELRVKVDGKNTDQKPNTPRSKHSATEQRRRSKINDRFQMLRELIPHSDQKRDKASFLLEVIEYIQFLQEKVQKFEGSYLGWNQEPAKLMPWRNNPKSTESYVDQARAVNNGSVPALVFAAKFDEKNVAASPTILGNAQNPIESDLKTPGTLKTTDHNPVVTNKALPFPMALQPNFYNPVKTAGVVTQLPSRLMSNSGNTSSQPQLLLSNTRSSTSDPAVASDRLKEKELTIEGGSINISTVYSQGLLNTLTQALQNSGVDLSQASISVQIDLGKRASGRASAPSSSAKDNQNPSTDHGTTRSRVDINENSDHALKKLKTDKRQLAS